MELRSGQKLLEVGPACTPVRVVKFSPDGKLIVTGHDTGAVQVKSNFILNSIISCSLL